MKKYLAILIVSMLCFTAEAQSPTKPIFFGINAGDGTYAVTISGGTITAVAPLPVFTPGTPVPPIPVPPTPDDLSPNAKAIFQAATAVQGDPKMPETAGQLAELYRQIGQKIQDGAIKGPEMVNLAVNYGTQTLLNGRGSAVANGWKPVRAVIDAQLMKSAQDGATDAQYVALLADVSDGLDAAAPNQPQIDIAMIMAIIKMILEILALFS